MAISQRKGSVRAGIYKEVDPEWLSLGVRTGEGSSEVSRMIGADGTSSKRVPRQRTMGLPFVVKGIEFFLK